MSVSKARLAQITSIFEPLLFNKNGLNFCKLYTLSISKKKSFKICIKLMLVLFGQKLYLFLHFFQFSFGCEVGGRSSTSEKFQSNPIFQLKFFVKPKRRNFYRLIIFRNPLFVYDYIKGFDMTNSAV